MNSIELRNVKFQWPGSQGFGLSLSELTIAQNEKVLLLGESGSGKSTLLSLLCGIVTATQGDVKVMGTDLNEQSARARDRFRADHMGIIFQQFNLLPYATVADNITLPLRFSPQRRGNIGNIEQELDRLLAALNLPKDIRNKPARQLSVGQQQRVAAARALIGSPPIIIADEPTSALDAQSQGAFLDMMFTQASQTQTSILMVSHDERLSDRFDRAVRLEDITGGAQ